MDLHKRATKGVNGELPSRVTGYSMNDTTVSTPKIFQPILSVTRAVPGHAVMTFFISPDSLQDHHLRGMVLVLNTMDKDNRTSDITQVMNIYIDHKSQAKICLQSGIQNTT